MNTNSFAYYVASHSPTELADKLSGFVALAAVALGAFGRAYHVIRNGGGLVGIYRGLVFGTNSAPTEEKKA